MDGKRLQRNLKTKDIYHCVRDAVLREHGEYGFATTVRSLSGQYQEYSFFVRNKCLISLNDGGISIMEA